MGDHEQGLPAHRGRVRRGKGRGRRCREQGAGGSLRRRRQQDRPQRPRHFHRQGQKEEAEGVGEENQGQQEEQNADRGGSVGVGGQDQRIEGALGREEGGEEVSLVYGYSHFSVFLQRALRFSVRASVAFRHSLLPGQAGLVGGRDIQKVEATDDGMQGMSPLARPKSAAARTVFLP